MRLIDADALKKALAKNITIWTFNVSYDGILAEIIDNAPTVEERKQGEWKLHGMIYYCSECGHDYEQGGNNFCGNCGADMRGGAE